MHSNDFKVIGFALEKKSSKGYLHLNNLYTFINCSVVPFCSIYFRYLYNMYFKFFETVHFTCILSTIEWKKNFIVFCFIAQFSISKIR